MKGIFVHLKQYKKELFAPKKEDFNSKKEDFILKKEDFVSKKENKSSFFAKNAIKNMKKS